MIDVSFRESLDGARNRFVLREERMPNHKYLNVHSNEHSQSKIVAW